MVIVLVNRFSTAVNLATRFSTTILVIFSPPLNILPVKFFRASRIFDLSDPLDPLDISVLSDLFNEAVKGESLTVRNESPLLFKSPDDKDTGEVPPTVSLLNPSTFPFNS